MIVLDANVLLCAYDSTSSQHRKARNWLERTLSNGSQAGVPWQTVTAFLCIMTNPRLPGERFTLEDGVQIVEAWLAQPNMRFLGPGDEHWPLLHQMIMWRAKP